MKLWQKIFLITFALFIVAFDAGIFVLSNLSYHASINTARGQAFMEYDFVKESFSTDLSAELSRNSNNSTAVEALMQYYIGFYQKRHVILELLQNGNSIFGNIPKDAILQPSNTNNEYVSTIVAMNERKWLIVSGKLLSPLDTYALVYAVDITKIYDDQAAMTNKLIFVGIGITAGFSAMLFIILRRLTKPIRILQAAADKVAEGDYDARTNNRGYDDISDLAVRFDEMTAQVSAHLSEQMMIAQSKQEFIDNFAHELRTPLTTIYGNAELLKHTRLSEDERIDAISSILDNVKRMQHVSQKLLDMALTRETAIEWHTVNLQTLFETVADSQNTRQIEKNLKVIIDRHVDSIQGDFVLLQTLLINLLDNAVKASRESGNVYLSAYFQEGSVVLEVRDEGCGMAKEHLQRVFEPFYRTDKARSRKEGGAGLGLALCKQIAEAHHATLRIASELGQGTTAFVKITTPQQLDDNSAT